MKKATQKQIFGKRKTQAGACVYFFLYVLYVRSSDLRVVALGCQSFHDPVLMLRSKGFYGDFQLHSHISVDGNELVVLQLDNVSVFLRENRGRIL